MPFVSLAQEGFLHAHPEKLGAAGLKEWDAATKGRHLPEHVKPSGQHAHASYKLAHEKK